MIFSTLFTILFLALIAVGVLFSVKSFMKGGSKKIKPATIALVAVGVIGISVIPASFHTVETGEIAVVKHLGDAQKVRTPGTYFDFCLTETYDYYDAKVQNLEVRTQAYSKDAQTMDIAMTVQYQIRKDNAIDIANHYGSVEVMANRIEAIAVEKTKAKLSSYSAMEIIETRSEISPLVEEAIKAAVDEDYYVDIVTVVLTNIDFSDAFEQTVEDKMIAEQEKMKAEYEKETAIVNAEKELEVAKLEAQAKLERAKADAEAQIAIAEAEAKAIKLKSIEAARALGFAITEENVMGEDGLTVVGVEYEIDFTGKSADEIKLITEYLKYIEYLDKWDGELPSVMTGDSASIMIPVDPSGSTGN
ncbi:MAG: prohibitin family protein [Clostridia bacterium]|nr:prohibitin family protein [Clostridia bacterium]MBQ9733646.1 prohibitin family protein [Clostridia bacterium]